MLSLQMAWLVLSFSNASLSLDGTAARMLKTVLQSSLSLCIVMTLVWVPDGQVSYLEWQKRNKFFPNSGCGAYL